jgi:hypothetical protein
MIGIGIHASDFWNISGRLIVIVIESKSISIYGLLASANWFKKNLLTFEPAKPIQTRNLIRTIFHTDNFFTRGE